MADGWDNFAKVPDNTWDKYAPAQSEGKSSLGRWAGLTARNLIQGAAAVPSMVMNAEGGLYNAGANLVQGYHAPDEANGPFRFRSAQQNTDAMLTKAGLPQPETGGERLGSDIAQGIAGVGGSLGIARGLQALQKPVAQAVGRTLAANPGKQLIGGGTGAGAAGAAREAGAPVPVQMAAGLAGGAAPFAGALAPALVRGGALAPAEQRVAQAGYTIPPATTDDPSTFSRLLGGWSGKIKSQQGASVKNQALTNQIAASELNLPRDTELTPDVFKSVRRNAAVSYGDVSRANPVTAMDEPFIDSLLKIESRNSQVADYFPELSDNKEVTGLVNSLSKHTEVPTPVLMDTIRTLREDATKNLQAIGAADKANLGFAQRSAANALEELIDRNLTKSGNTEAIAKFRAARQLIAKSHDIESATNPSTGEVGAARFGALMKRGKPLSGGLATIADAANTIPKATQMPSRFGGMEPLSVLDILGSAGSVAAGHPELGLTLLGRPLARTLTLSKAYQKAMANRAPMGAAGLLPSQLNIQSNIYGNNQ